MTLLVVALAAVGALTAWATIVPVRFARWLGAGIGMFVGSVLRIRRAHVEDAMARASVPDPAATASRMYRSLGISLLELLWAWSGPSRRLDELVEVSRARFDDARALGRGVVLAAAHTGNWDLVACAAARVTPLTVVTKHLSIGWLDSVWQRGRSRTGVRLVAEGSVAECASRVLARGEALAMMVDQAPERRRAVVEVDFLGARALADLSPALIAMRARCPLVSTVARRRADGVTEVRVQGVYVPPARPNREWARRATIEISRELERFVLEHPEQWLWMHRRWKGVPPGSVRQSEAGVLAA